MSLEQSRDKTRPHAAEETPESGRIALSVAEFGKRTDLSRSLIYEAIKVGDLQSIKVRGRRLILVEDGISWLRSHRDRVMTAADRDRPPDRIDDLSGEGRNR